ncbi:MAG: hypothetical protein WCB46_09935, partial [Methanoregula sp.]
MQIFAFGRYRLIRLFKRENENLKGGRGVYPTLTERPATIELLHQYFCGDALFKHCPAPGAIRKAVAGSVSEDPARREEIGSCTILIFCSGE